MFDLILKKTTIDTIFFLLLIIGTINTSQQQVNVTLSLDLGSLASSLDFLSTSSDLQSNQNSECVKKFSPLIATLPANCQSQIVSVFKSNTQSGRCCLPSNFIQSVKGCLVQNLNRFTQTMTNLAQKNKAAFTCYKNNEIFKALNNLPISQEERENDNKFLKQVLLNFNELSHKMSKCLSGLNLVSLEILSRMCLPTSSLSKFFKTDSSGNFYSVIKMKKDDVDVYSHCEQYFRNHTAFSDTVLNAYIDQVNYLLGVDQCNYYSDFFNFDINQDQNDLYFPSQYVPKNTPDSFDTLLNNWATCASTKPELLSFAISTLKTNITISQKNNPNGLSTFIGRADINFDIIKRTFYLEKFPYFHVKCVGKTCTAYCETCSNLAWDSNNVVTGNGVSNLDVSCCNGNCVVYIAMISPAVTGSEIFTIKGDSSRRDTDSLMLEKLKNAQYCFQKRKGPRQGFNGTNSTNFNSTRNSTWNSTSNSTSNQTRNFTFNNFSDSGFMSLITDVLANSKNYNIDFRLGTSLNLVLEPYNNGTRTTIMNFLTQDLYARNDSFYFSCELGVCIYQCRNCSENNKTYVIYKNTTLLSNTTNITNSNFTSSRKLAKKSSSSGKSSSSKSSGSSFSSSSSKSSGSSFSSSSSSKPSGSSLTGGSSSFSSSSSSKSSGSSLTGGSSSSFSSSSSSKSSGSSLTGGSSSKTGGFMSNSGSGSTGSFSSSTGTSSRTGGSTLNAASSTNLGKSTGTFNSYNSGSSINTQPKSQLTGTAAQLSYNSPVSSSSTSVKYSGYTSSTFYPSTNYASSTTTKIKIKTYSYNTVSVKTYSNNYNSNFVSSYNNAFSSRTTLYVKTKYYYSTSYYPSYTSFSVRYRFYRPTYYDYYHGRGIYYLPSWGFYSYYYIPGYNFYYYRAPSPYYNYNQPRQQYNYNGAVLSPDYNPLDWMPEFRQPFNLTSYMSNLNDKFNQVKIQVECCQLFCVTYIESFDDGYSNTSNGKKRIFLDINLRNYLFLDSLDMKPSTKRCIMDGIYNKYWNSTNVVLSQNTTLGIPETCGLDTPFKTFPLKNSCKQELNQYCGMNSFNQLVERFFPANSGNCSIAMMCPNITESSSDDEKAACGSLLSSKFMINEYRVSYNGIAFPCGSTSNTVQPGLFIQTHLMKARLRQSTNTTTNTSTTTNSKYVNENSLTSSEKNEISSTTSNVQSSGTITVVIDNNSNSNVNQNVDSDLSKINSDVAVIQASNGTRSSSGSFAKVSVLLALFITLFL